MQGLEKGVSGKPYPRLCNTRRPRLEPRTFWSQAVRLYRLHQSRPTNIYRKRTSEKATESEWNKNEQVHKCADLARQKMDSFEKKLIGHKNDLNGMNLNIKRTNFLQFSSDSV